MPTLPSRALVLGPEQGLGVQTSEASEPWSPPHRAGQGRLSSQRQRRPRRLTRTLWEADISVTRTPSWAPVGQTQE